MEDIRSDRFEAWVSRKLVSLNSDVDLDIYVSYVVGILENELPSDARESLIDILSGIISEASLDDAITQIISKWIEINESISNQISNYKEEIDWNSKMQDIINKQAPEAVPSKSVNTLDGHQKALILANYSQVSDGEESDDNAISADSKLGSIRLKSGDDLVRNNNVLMVKEREKEAKDKAKVEAQIKKEKDKEDKEKQKQKSLDRKENEKKRTQKVEKRR